MGQYPEPLKSEVGYYLFLSLFLGGSLFLVLFFRGKLILYDTYRCASQGEVLAGGSQAIGCLAHVD